MACWSCYLPCHPDPDSVVIPPIPVHIDPTDTLPNRGHIRFDDMQIGQRSRYLYFHINYEFYSEPSDTLIDYRPDTLVVAITGQDADGFIIKEFLTQGSASILSAAAATANQIETPDSVWTYHLRADQDSLYIIPRLVLAAFVRPAEFSSPVLKPYLLPPLWIR